MEQAKVYFTDLHAHPGRNRLQKLRDLMLAAGIRDEYASEFQEPYFELTIQKTGDDTFQAAVAFTMLNSPEDWDTAEVELECDTACLKSWITELEQAEKRFPPRS